MAGVDVARLVVAIVDRAKGARLADVYRELRLPFDYLCRGHGTANSRILDYLGLSETEKDIAFAFVPARRVRAVAAAVDERLGLSIPGRGILFSVPLSGLSGQVHQAVSEDQVPDEDAAWGAKGATVDTSGSYDLIVAVVDRGNVDVVMDAARACGARGGTVVHGRRTGIAEGAEVFGVSLEPEKDIVLIVVAHGQKLDIMRSVSKAAGPATPGRGILFSVPVDDVMGLPDPGACLSGEDGADAQDESR